MYKRLRIYYFYTILPFALLLLGAVFYRDAIAKTIVSNPHPQINYAIFVIVVVGGILILLNLMKLMKEGKFLSSFSELNRSGAEPEQLKELALRFDADIAYVLRMLAASSGQAITHQEQVAIEQELEKASRRLGGHNAVPQFLSGLLVGMGLLGTFVGLLSTLGDISDLISTFATLDVANANPIEVFRNMVQRMKAPMSSMAIAFSASMYGLLGSIVLGLMLVAVKRCMGDILSRLGSEVAQHIEFALATEGFAYSKSAMKQGYGYARRSEPLTVQNLVASPTGQAQGGAGEGGFAQSIPAKQDDLTTKVAGVSTLAGASGFAEPAGSEFSGEEIRVLRRIEERLAESARIQDRALLNEIDQFNKQRGEMLHAMTEHAESVSQFRSEIQRVGRQLGTILDIMERGNSDMQTRLNEHFTELTKVGSRQSQNLSVVSDMMVRMADDSAESRRLMTVLINIVGSSIEELRAMKPSTSSATGVQSD